MFTPGNHKLGGRRIWGFGLPSGTPDVCPGLSETCQTHCYAVAVERYRPAAAARYRQNLALTHRRDFVRRVLAFFVLHRVRVARLHVGGDFYSAGYARKWLTIVGRSPRTLFYFYTRSWRTPEIRTVLDRMANEPNCQVWFSADRDTGLPTDMPPTVRVAWLLTAPEETPPTGTGLVFRVRRLRRSRADLAGTMICPAEDGVPRSRRVTCDRCGHCWRPADGGRTPLPIIDPPHP